MSVILWVLAVIFLFVVLIRVTRKTQDMHVALIVLGDIGRSPRMEFHAIELSRTSPVSVICYRETEPIADIVQNKNITLYSLSVLPPLKNFPLRTVVWLTCYAPVKFIFLAFQLFYHLLFKMPACSHILIQNPPSLPSFFIAAIVKFLTGCKVIVDWHNTAYSIVMNVHNMKESNFVIQALKWYELFLPRYFDYHFTVTEAMKMFLIEHKIHQELITVLYDKPFVSLTQTETSRYNIFKQIEHLLPQNAKAILELFRNKTEKVIIGVSSTSWTPDEDFSVLFDALLKYEKIEEKLNEKVPKLLIFITGRGPLKEFYEKKIAEENMQRVCVVPIWLTHEDYPKVLSSCDFGISLHQSSSQLDLPMKVLDMYGCGLPVFARGYPALKTELVVEGKFGYCFDDAQQLEILFEKNIINEQGRQVFLGTMKKNVSEQNNITWSQNWRDVVEPYFRGEKQERVKKD
ncbi:chitobiosyldiphosphodolichol beta-mannosyltransferase, putative [Entamoeba invadens IP1]|uniref:Chitobiosyldiphosphodolichol beta-mannosyltransferase, putative n=1 Tax=Entamoeba invadens IP1 TaxID=370355 RepID=A0A0A1U7S6_ENTIV|nr:chitobiosyldiphosphodolichol beta-mannosyltransferase, putative [Entamoeba invadens IP1]ELP89140.1 chitobiosyldiphosphodolichol beta-mannosyltransferase, putative [Entamoeba invadens IP1]|eukprot:XP_004255911.1 chitobiosyldiphosphodolichol beta-mannosyltransferase, putative [Entamoeba invadens IP1]